MVAAIWLAAALAALAFAAKTDFGPVFVIVTRNHGIHVGDVVGAVVILAAASALSKVARRR